jgi:glutathione S-transferase
MPQRLDDKTVDYILATRAAFEDLTQVASQLAGLLVLAASGAKSAAPDHPMLAIAGDRLVAATDGLQRARPTERAAPHHLEAIRAALWLGESLSRAREWLRGDRPQSIDAILVPLRAGYAHLQAASDRLPGFPLVAFDQGCCAVGGALTPAPSTSSFLQTRSDSR